MGVALLHHPFEILEIRIVPSISVYILSIPIPIWVAPGLWKPPSSTVVFPWFSSGHAWSCLVLSAVNPEINQASSSRFLPWKPRGWIPASARSGDVGLSLDFFFPKSRFWREFSAKEMDDKIDDNR